MLMICVMTNMITAEVRNEEKSKRITLNSTEVSDKIFLQLCNKSSSAANIILHCMPSIHI